MIRETAVAGVPRRGLVSIQPNHVRVASPTKVAASFYQVVLSGEMVRALGESLTILIPAYVLSAIFGIAVGVIMGRYRVAERALDSFVTTAYVAPHSAFIPLIILWLGFGFTAKVFYVASSVTFTVLINTFLGVRDVSRLQVEVGKAFVAKERQILYKIVLPGSLPYIIAGLRLGIGRAVKGVVAAEFLMTLSGLGGLIINYGNALQISNMFAPLVLFTLLAVGMTEAIKLAERRLAPWKETERAAR